MSASGGTPFYESPWFWGYAFSAAVLAGLLLFDDRIVARQSQIENQYFARQEHGQSVVPPGERAARQESEDPLISMEPFYVLAGLGFVVCWGMFLYERLFAAAPLEKPRPAPREQSPEGARMITTMLENPVPILIVGLLAAAAFGVAFVSTGRLPLGIAVLVLLVITGALLALEWFVETDREQVEHSLYDTASAIQSNDAAGVLEHISQLSPQVRAKAEQELALYTIAGFKINSLEINMESDHKPPLATAKIDCMATGRSKRESPPNHSVPAVLTLNLRREDDGVWRVTSYTARIGVSGFRGGRGDEEFNSSP